MISNSISWVTGVPMDLLTSGLGIWTKGVLRLVWESLPSLNSSETFFSPSLNVAFLNVPISPVGSCLSFEPLQHLVPLLTLPSISCFTPVLTGVLEWPLEASGPVVMVCPTPQMSSPGEKQVGCWSPEFSLPRPEPMSDPTWSVLVLAQANKRGGGVKDGAIWVDLQRKKVWKFRGPERSTWGLRNAEPGSVHIL